MRGLLALAMVCLVGASAPTRAGCSTPTDGPRTLVIALDGVPLRLIEQAREQGAFASWDTPRPLVSTFPSVTNVSFTAMFAPFGVEPAGGYEVQFFDWVRNEVVGGHPWGYNENLFAWRQIFDFTSTTVGGKLSIYTNPAGNAWKEIDEAETLVLETNQQLVLAHAGATDAMLHLKGDKAVLDVLLGLDERLEQMRERHAEERGAPLQIVLLSDHGNTDLKVKSADGVRKKLKKAGLRPWPHLEEPDDVVAATFGILNYGVLFTRPENGERAAVAMVNHKTVDLAVWRAGPQEIGIVTKDSGVTARRHRGRIRWKDVGGERLYAYVNENGDPLDLEGAVAAMRAAERLAEDGEHPWAGERAWLETSVDSRYPNAPRRLVDGLTGNFVANNATVIFSLKPGFGWGWQSAYASSFIWGGRLEGTHGGLDRDSSLGFFMSDVAIEGIPPVMTVTDVLAPFADLDRCRTPDARLTETRPGNDVVPETSGH